MEIEELRRQRDIAQSQVDELRKKLKEDEQVSLHLSSDITLLNSLICHINLSIYLHYPLTSGYKHI